MLFRKYIFKEKLKYIYFCIEKKITMFCKCILKLIYAIKIILEKWGFKNLQIACKFNLYKIFLNYGTLMVHLSIYLYICMQKNYTYVAYTNL